MRMPEGLTVPLIHEPLIPLAVGSKKNLGHKNGNVLAGDVGGTKTNVALFELKDGRLFLQKYGHVSWERLLSGQGICDTYQLMREVRGGNETDAFKAKMKKEDPAAVITKTAMEGTDTVCMETLDLFVRFLAIETAQLALKFKATGGIYIGGGILPKIIKGMNREVFNNNFMQSGRLNSLLQMVPVNVILNDNTALLGAGYYAAMSIE